MASTTPTRQQQHGSSSSASFMPNFPAVNGEQRTALQFAFYNTLLFSLLGICLTSIFAVYQMFYMFLMPMLWASLIGTVLFPLKRLISDNLKGWLDRLDEEDRPLLVGIALLPIQITMQFSNFVYRTTLSYTGFYIGFGYILLKVLCYYGAFTALLNCISRFYMFSNALIQLFTQKWVFLLILLYSLGFAGWIYLQELGQINKKFARVLSLPIWLVILAHVSNLFGFLRVFMFALCCSLLGLISAGIIDADGFSDEEKTQEDKPEGKHKEDGRLEGDSKTKTEDKPKTAIAISDTRLDQALSSDAHLRIIGGLCALLWVVNHDSMLFFLIIPFIIALVAQIADQIGLNQYLWNCLVAFKDQVIHDSSKFVHVVVAGSLRKFVRLLFTSDRMFISGLRARAELISSICVMGILAIGGLVSFLFMAFQLHSETVHLVKLGGNVLSSNPDWLKYALNYTGDGRNIDGYMEQAYQQGRAWLASNIRQLADPKDPARADHLEEQAKLLVDNLYQLWEERGQRIYEESFGDTGETTALWKRPRWEDNGDQNMDGNGNGRGWMARLVRNANLAMWKTELTEVVTQNIETVWTITQSVWHIVLMNLSLLSTVLVAVVSLLLEFSFDLLNFLIECIVFLTAVYYLLASSSDQWLPIQWLHDLSASFQLSQLSPRGHDSLNVAKAAENAIHGVFVLSAKMAIFYGLYTYFVHSLFSLNVVIIPSMLAAILAAIPIFPPYSVALFGVVELYLVRGEPVGALVFIASSVAPLFFADPAFYRELKGSHPYVTGLAVIGGIYWLGLQGAIIGPIILCLMVALLNIYAEFAGAPSPNRDRDSLNQNK